MNKNKPKYRTFEEFAIESFKEDPQLADEYLELALEEYQKDGDEAVLLLALRKVAIARGGFSKLAQKTGLSRENLYKTLSIKGNPRFHSLKLILEALGYSIFFKHCNS
jgi:probable addiction module antidote protein